MLFWRARLDAFKTQVQGVLFPCLLSFSLFGLGSCYALHLAKGAQLEADGEYEKAICQWDNVIASNPKSGISYFHRAYDNAKLGRYQKTIDDASKAIELTQKKSTKLRALITRANAYMHLDQYQNVLADCNEAINLQPKIGTAYFFRAQAYQKLGNIGRAKLDMDKAKKCGYNIEPRLTDY